MCLRLRLQLCRQVATRSRSARLRLRQRRRQRLRPARQRLRQRQRLLQPLHLLVLLVLRLLRQRLLPPLGQVRQCQLRPLRQPRLRPWGQRPGSRQRQQPRWRQQRTPLALQGVLRLQRCARLALGLLLRRPLRPAPRQRRPCQPRQRESRGTTTPTGRPSWAARCRARQPATSSSPSADRSRRTLAA